MGTEQHGMLDTAPGVGVNGDSKYSRNNKGYSCFHLLQPLSLWQHTHLIKRKRPGVRTMVTKTMISKNSKKSETTMEEQSIKGKKLLNSSEQQGADTKLQDRKALALARGQIQTQRQKLGSHFCSIRIIGLKDRNLSSSNSHTDSGTQMRKHSETSRGRRSPQSAIITTMRTKILQPPSRDNTTIELCICIFLNIFLRQNVLRYNLHIVKFVPLGVECNKFTQSMQL